MSKVNLSDVANLFGSPTSAANTINANSALIEAAFDNTISRDGSTPNQMGANLDMNHYDLLNINTLSVDDIIVDGTSVITRIANEASIRAAADTALSLRISQIEHGAPIDTHIFNPLQFGAKGDGVTDDTLALQNMIASGHKVFDWLGPEYTYKISQTLKVRDTDVVWYGSAKLVWGGAWCQPMVVVYQTAQRFFASSNLTYDHNGQITPAASRLDDLSLALGSCFLVMAPDCHVGGRFLNSFDVGLGFCDIDFSGDGSLLNPYSVSTQRNAHPVGGTVDFVYGNNCGIGEHVSLDGLTHWNQGAAIDVLTASSINVGRVVAEECFCGVVCDFNSQSQAVFGSITTFGTKQDSRLPGGSGMGIYCGGFMTVGSYYSNNDVIGIVGYNNQWTITIGAGLIWAPGKQGVILAGGIGRFQGNVSIGAAGRTQAGVAAFDVSAGSTELIDIDATIHTWTSTTGTYGYGYRGLVSSGGKIRGNVKLHEHGQATVAAFFTQGYENIEHTNVNGDVVHYNASGGRHSYGGAATATSQSIMQIQTGTGVDVGLAGGPGGINLNCYWDGTNFRFTNNGWAAVFRMNPTSGLLDIDISNASGLKDAVVTFNTMATFTSTATTMTGFSFAGVTPVANGGTGVTSSTGTGSVVLNNSPTLVTPALGTPSSATLTNATGLPVATGISGLGTGVAAFLATPTSANLATAVTNETGTGALVFATSPTLVTPALGTPASGVLTNATGLPLTTGVTGVLPTANGGLGTSVFSGTWTPALKFGGNAVGLATSLNQGNYTRIGNLVYYQALIALTSKGSSTGAVTVTGIPFTPPTQYSVAQVVALGTMASWSASKTIITNGTATMNMYTNTATGDVATTDAQFTNSSTILIQGILDLNSLT